jgi:hypothetical protein
LRKLEKNLKKQSYGKMEAWKWSVLGEEESILVEAW